MARIIFISDRLTDLDSNVHIRMIDLVCRTINTDSQYITNGEAIKEIKLKGGEVTLSACHSIHVKEFTEKDTIVDLGNKNFEKHCAKLDSTFRSRRVKPVVLPPHEDVANVKKQEAVHSELWSEFTYGGFFRSIARVIGRKALLKCLLTSVRKKQTQLLCFTPRAVPGYITRIKGLRLESFDNIVKRDLARISLEQDFDNVLVLGHCFYNMDYEHRKKPYTYQEFIDKFAQFCIDYEVSVIIGHPRGVDVAKSIAEKCGVKLIFNCFPNASHYYVAPGSMALSLKIKGKKVSLLSYAGTENQARLMAGELSLDMINLDFDLL